MLVHPAGLSMMMIPFGISPSQRQAPARVRRYEDFGGAKISAQGEFISPEHV